MDGWMSGEWSERGVVIVDEWVVVEVSGSWVSGELSWVSGVMMMSSRIDGWDGD